MKVVRDKASHGGRSCRWRWNEMVALAVSWKQFINQCTYVHCNCWCLTYLHAGVDFSLILVDRDSLMMQCIEDNLSIWHLHTAVDFDDVATPMIKVSTLIIFNMACCICHLHVGFFVGVQWYTFTHSGIFDLDPVVIIVNSENSLSTDELYFKPEASPLYVYMFQSSCTLSQKSGSTKCLSFSSQSSPMSLFKN